MKIFAVQFEACEAAPEGTIATLKAHPGLVGGSTFHVLREEDLQAWPLSARRVCLGDAEAAVNDCRDLTVIRDDEIARALAEAWPHRSYLGKPAGGGFPSARNHD